MIATYKQEKIFHALFFETPSITSARFAIVIAPLIRTTASDFSIVYYQ